MSVLFFFSLSIIPDLICELLFDYYRCVAVHAHESAGAFRIDPVFEQQFRCRFLLVSVDDHQKPLCTHNISHSHSNCVGGNILFRGKETLVRFDC